MTQYGRRILYALAFALMIGGGFAVSVPAEATEAAWAKLANGGYTILLRHGLTTSQGDPVDFTLGDCATQTPLSSNGRQQVRRQGTRFAARAVSITTVYTSEWCRAIDTAELAFGSQPIEPIPELNRLGVLGSEAEDQARIEATIERINGFRGSGNQVFITHPENIIALTGSRSRDGEAIILGPVPEGGELPDVVGRILLN